MADTRQSETFGVLLVLASTVAFSTMALGVRMAKESFRPDTLMFYRSVIQVLILLPWAWSVMPKVFPMSSSHVRSHLLRGIFGFGAMYCLYFALQMLPIAMAHLIGLTFVFWAALLARIFLKERLSQRRSLFAVVICGGLLLSVYQGGRGVLGDRSDWGGGVFIR